MAAVLTLNITTTMTSNNSVCDSKERLWEHYTTQYELVQQESLVQIRRMPPIIFIISIIIVIIAHKFITYHGYILIGVCAHGITTSTTVQQPWI